MTNQWAQVFLLPFPVALHICFSVLHGILTIELSASLGQVEWKEFVQIIFIECLEAKVLPSYSYSLVNVVTERLNEWLIKGIVSWNCSNENDFSSGTLSHFGSPRNITTLMPGLSGSIDQYVGIIYNRTLWCPWLFGAPAWFILLTFLTGFSVSPDTKILINWIEIHMILKCHLENTL